MNQDNAELDIVFEQLAKEMVRFSQDNVNNSTALLNFFRYELYLRCVSKRYLKIISQETEPKASQIILQTYSFEEVQE